MNFKQFFAEDEQKLARVIDTDQVSPDDQWKLGSAAQAEIGHLLSWHVTDDPQKALQSLGTKKLTATYRKGMGKYSELGPGLYLSAAPQLWACRSTGKFDFLQNITPDEKQRLYNAILSDLWEKVQPPSYITQSEFEAASRNLRNWISQADNPKSYYFIISLAGQPYNVHFWRPDFLRNLGIEGAKPPQMIKFTLRGKFVDLSSNYGHINAWRPYLMQGFHGAFLKSDPQLVVWRNDAIVGAQVEKGSVC